MVRTWPKPRSQGYTDSHEYKNAFSILFLRVAKYVPIAQIASCREHHDEPPFTHIPASLESEIAAIH